MVVIGYIKRTTSHDEGQHERKGHADQELELAGLVAKHQHPRKRTTRTARKRDEQKHPFGHASGTAPGARLVDTVQGKRHNVDDDQIGAQRRGKGIHRFILTIQFRNVSPRTEHNPKMALMLLRILSLGSLASCT